VSTFLCLQNLEMLKITEGIQVKQEVHVTILTLHAATTKNNQFTYQKIDYLISMKNLLLALSLILSLGCAAQENWADDISLLVYDKCTRCHHTGGAAPFTLTSYQDVVSSASIISQVLNDNSMPPWPADTSYRRFANENVLTSQEKQSILNWINNGTPSGNLANAPAPPAYPPGESQLDTIDYTVEIDPYTLQYNTDEYRWFVVQTNFTDTVYVSKIEVIPGLPSIVHHADISYDMTGNSLALDNADPLPGFNSSTGAPTYSHYMNAWQPGADIAEYPDDWGIMIPPGADFVLEIHYGPGGAGLIDSTKMNLQFISNSSNNVRPVYANWLLTDSPPVLVDGPLVIPANQIKPFHQERTINTSLSIISISPHMHYLGRSYKVWAITPANDTIRLIDIPKWDFNWQRYYHYPIIQTLPAGTTIYSEGVYDNTTNNPNNPNNPPVTVYKGPYTTDEMFLCYFIYAVYEPGDENIVIDSNIAFLNVKNREGLEANLYPNPANEQLTVQLSEPVSERITFEIYSTEGKLLKTVSKYGNGSMTYHIMIGTLPEGLYYLRYVNKDRQGTEKFIKN
jgi:hypothetical protein